MRFTNLPLLRAALTLALLAVLGGAFVVVNTNGGSGQSVPISSGPPVTTTTERISVGVVAGELAAQGQAETARTATTIAEPRAVFNTPLAAAVTPRISIGSTTTSVAESTTTTIPSTSEPPTTTAPPTTNAPTTAPPTTAPPTTTTTTPPATTTTTVVSTTTTTAPPSGGVLTESQAREIFALYFAESDVDRAIEVAICESGLNTAAYNPAGYGGLFQHSIAYWDDRAASAGWAGASIYDAHANSAVSAWLVNSSGWHHWPNC